MIKSQVGCPWRQIPQGVKDIIKSTFGDKEAFKKSLEKSEGDNGDGVVNLFLWSDDVDYRPIMKHECQHSVWANLTRAEKDEIVKQVLDKNIVGMTDYVMDIKTKAEVSKSPQAIKYYNELFAEELNSEWFALRDYKQEHEANTAEWVMMGEFDKFGAILESVLGKDYLKKSIIENMEMLKAVLNLPDSELQTWDGKRGIWGTIRGRKIFFPNGEDTEIVMKNELEKIKQLDNNKPEKEVKEKVVKYKPKVFKFSFGNIEFKGYGGKVVMDKGVKDTISQYDRILKTFIERKGKDAVKGLSKEGKAILDHEHKRSENKYKSVAAAADAWNKLPSEYREDVKILSIRSKLPSKNYGGLWHKESGKVEIKVMSEKFTPMALRHEVAHARWSATLLYLFSDLLCSWSNIALPSFDNPLTASFPLRSMNVFNMQLKDYQKRVRLY